jgi:hypothetical protein
MHRPLDCPHCHHHTHLVAPPAWARALVPVAWVVAAAMVFAAGMIGPFIMLALPLLFACGAGLIGGAHALAGEPATCGRCGKIVADEAIAPAPRIVAVPARASDSTALQA